MWHTIWNIFFSNNSMVTMPYPKKKLIDFPKKSYSVQLSSGKYTYKNPIIFSLRIILKLSNPYPISYAFFYHGGASVNLTILGNLGRNWQHSNSYKLNQTCLYPVFGRNSSLTPNFQELFLNDDKGNAGLFTPASLRETKKCSQTETGRYFFLS